MPRVKPDTKMGERADMNSIEKEQQELRNKFDEAVLRVSLSMITAFFVTLLTIKLFAA